MRKRLIVVSITFLLAISFLTILPSTNADPDTWWNSNWDYYIPITIASSYINDTLTNFPVLISSTDTTLIGKCDSGNSIRFLDTDNSTEFYYEIESWSASNFNVWVNVTTISSSSDTTILMYYGNSVATDNQNPTNVWHSNYITVHHMIDTTSSLISDSTSNNHDGSKYATGDPSQVIGKIDYAQYFDSYNDHISLGDSPDYILGDDFTISLWINTDEETTYDYYMGHFDSGSAYWVTQLYQGKLGWGADGGVGGANYHVASWNPTVDTWYNLVWSVSSSTLTCYVDGSSIGTIAIPTVQDIDANLILGQETTGTSSGIVGTLDEIRISTIGYDSSWIETDFHSQNQTSGFLTFGNEYTQLPPNNPPYKPTCISPTHNEENVLLDTTLKTHVIDTDGDTMSVSFYWSDNTLIETVTNIQNDTDAETSSLALDYETTYNWYAIANDSLLENTSDIFTFTTIPNISPNKPDNPIPINTTINISIYTTLKIHVIDMNDDTMTVSFYWSNNTLIETVTNVVNNSYAETSDLSLNRLIEYSWYAIANDSLLENTSDTFSFTTVVDSPDKPTCVSPTHNEENVSLDTTLKVHVIDITNDTMNVSFYWSDNTLIETVTNIQNDTDAETSSLALDYSTEYNWYAIANDSLTETQSDTFIFTTEPMPNYTPVKPTCISPLNNSIDISITTTLKVHVIDVNNDTMAVSFYWSNNTLIETVTNIQNDTDAETSSLALDYETTYNWYAIANDSLLETKSNIFIFTTGVIAIPICEHSIPRVQPDGYLYMIYRNGDINVSNLNLLMGGYSPFSVWKFNYTSENWDSELLLINTNDYIKVKINESDMPYNDTLIPITPQIRFKITDADVNDKLNIIVKSNSSGSWIVVKEWSNVSEGWFTSEDNNMDEYNTTYYYNINVTDSYDNSILRDYSLVTTSTEPTIPPITPSIDIYIYGITGIVILLGGGMYILSKKKRIRFK